MIDCGCSLADENPAFKALTGFFRMMEIARESNYTGSRKWVVIHLAGGIGNQLLQIVSGLMLALATGRLVAIEDRDKDAENLPGGHEFMFDSVLLFPYVYNLQLPMNASRPNSKITAEIEGLSWLLCKNWTLELEKWDIADVLFGQPPHVLFRNPFYGEYLKNTFHSKPFFFLSHFVWIGAALRDVKLQLNIWPPSQAWDGARSIDEFVLRLRASRPAKVIGVHSRIYSSRPFEYFDHNYLDLQDEEGDKARCTGDQRSLDELSNCVTDMVEKINGAAAAAPQSRRGSGEVVILWATDNDEMSSRLLRNLKSIGGVRIVSIAHSSTGSDRFDRFATAGQLDMLLLEEADILVGTTSSTFSFAVHARGLSTPLYPSFRRDRSTACGSAVGTEGGLLSYGAGYSQCRRDWIQREVSCGFVQAACLQFVMDATSTQSCIQDIGACPDKVWYSDFLLDLDHPRFTESWLTRFGLTFVSHHSEGYMPCPKRLHK